jgi:hypothetical protein
MRNKVKKKRKKINEKIKGAMWPRLRSQPPQQQRASVRWRKISPWSGDGDMNREFFPTWMGMVSQSLAVYSLLTPTQPQMCTIMGLFCHRICDDKLGAGSKQWSFVKLER